MVYKLGVLLTLLLFSILSWTCVDRDSRMISHDLEQTVSERANTAPMHGIAVRADGREMVLSGKVATEAAKAHAGEVAAAVWGVRSVRNDLTVAGDATAINAKIAQILLDKKVEFSTGTATLLPTSTPVLEEMLTELKKGAGLSIGVAGYTDDTGNAADNLALSEQRAQAVTAWFAQHGIESSRMHAIGFGPAHPIAPNTTPDGKAKNRRVEITTEIDGK